MTSSSRIPDLLELYGELADVVGTGDLYSARSVGGTATFRVAKDSRGNPAILFAAGAQSERSASPPIELPNLSFRPRCVCHVRSEPDPEVVETLAVLKCSTDDAMLREYFLRSASGLVAAMPDAPTEQEVAGAIGKLVELFRALDATPRTSLQGLWCELFLIARAPILGAAAAAWHADPHALHDFSASQQRVEVKSCIGPIRSHVFLLDQVIPQDGTTVIVASFVLDETGTGISISELWDEVSQRTDLSVELRTRLTQILALSLGRDWRKARRVAFDADSAYSQMRLFPASSIPKVDPALPAQVTHVQFRSELTQAGTISREEAAANGGLLAALFG